jgi:hypothetical protein
MPLCEDSTAQYSAESRGPVTAIVPEQDYSKIQYISPGGSDKQGNGSKEKPWRTIIFALTHLHDANTDKRYALCIAEGVYKESTIQMHSFIDCYGGFSYPGWQRDIYKYPTILSGGDKQRVLIGTDHSRLDGFIISRGVIRGKGAGILCDGISPVISNNVFVHNKTLAPNPWEPELRHQIANDGGAIYVHNGAAPVIENNLILGNMTEAGRGAGIALHGRCAGRIAKNVFMYNTAGLDDPNRSSDGGAISVFEWSDPIIENNIILENHALAKNDGGAIFSSYWCSPVIHRNTIVGNKAEDDGGGIFTGGQNHHDELPPQFDPIPAGKDFYIQITDNVFMGNNQALEFSMESRGLIANNIFAHNGEKKTYPTGLYSQRSEAHIINNTILDPFLINYQTFDNKPSSEGLGVSTIKNNRIWGSFDLQTDAIIEDNFIFNQTDGPPIQTPEIDNEWIQINADAVYYGKNIRKLIFTTELIVIGGNFSPTELVNRVIKAGDSWSVVKSNDAQKIEIWGDLTGEVSFLILPTYKLN